MVCLSVTSGGIQTGVVAILMSTATTDFSAPELSATGAVRPAGKSSDC